MTIEARFHMQRGDFTLDVDMHLPSRGLTALFGPSGCGKTSLLRAIAGLEPIRDGYLKVGDRLWQDGPQGLAPHKRPLGYVFQEPSLFAHLDVRRNLEYGLRRLPPEQHRVSLERAVDLLGIGHLLTRRPHQLSGGEQQRVAIARALAVSPALLLLDEPLAALDLALKQDIMPYLESLHRELDIPVLYVSHSRDEVARLGDHLVLMENGRAQASGPLNELFTRLDVSLAHDPHAETVIDGMVSGHDDDFKLTYVDFPGGRFVVARSSLSSGTPARLQVEARDVSITLERQSGTSILNIFAATVDDMVNEGEAQVTVRLLLGSVPLLARITRKSASDLNLEAGKPVYAQVKSVALLS